MKRRAVKSFEAWLKADDSGQNTETSISSPQWETEYRRSPRPGDQSGDQWTSAFLEDCASKIEAGSLLFRTVGTFPTDFELIGPRHGDKTHVRILQFSNCLNKVTLSNLRARELRFYGDRGPIRLANLYVDRLEFSNANCDCVLEDTWIGDLVLQFENFTSFSVSGGGILNIQCPVSGSPNPIRGSVVFRRSTYFPREVGFRLKGPQPYRNMRYHMEALQNRPAASLFFTLEQAVERKMHRTLSVDRFISWLYGALSDYGSSAGRPIWCFLGLFALSCAIVFLFDGAIPSDGLNASGWQQSMMGNGCAARLVRAIVLTGQATLNPLGVFGTRGLLIAKYLLLELWLLADGILSILVLALFLLAVRRRFKMP